MRCADEAFAESGLPRGGRGQMPRARAGLQSVISGNTIFIIINMLKVFGGVGGGAVEGFACL